MTSDPEFFDCLRSSCWISSNLLKKPYDAVWPLRVASERSFEMHVWSFYVRWKQGMAAHANHVRVCDMHHERLLDMVADSLGQDVREQEVTERWMISVASQLGRS